MLLAGCARAPAPLDATAPATPATRVARSSTAPDAPEAGAAPLPKAPAASTAHIALSGEGLSLISGSGATRHLLFGEPATQSIETISRVVGTVPDRGRNGECGAGPLDMDTWSNGLTLVSQDGRFVGWSVNPERGEGAHRPLATMAGVGLGSTRAQLQAAYVAEVRETTLGTEFEAGGLFGVLEGTDAAARINALWAGTSCVFR